MHPLKKDEFALINKMKFETKECSRALESRE